MPGHYNLSDDLRGSGYMTSGGFRLRASATPGAPSGVGVSNVINWLAIFYIVTSVFPAFYIPPVVLVLLLCIGTLDLFGRIDSGVRLTESPIPPYVPHLALLLSYMVASGLVSGLSIFDIFNYSAIRYDANIFYSTIFLFILGSGNLQIQQLDRWMYWTSIFAAAMYLLSLVTHIPLFESHNSAGGYFMVLLAYIVGRSLSDGYWKWAPPIIATTIALWMSDSRGSIVGIIGIILFMHFYRRFPKVARLSLILFSACMIVFLAVCYRIWQENGSIYAWDLSVISAVEDQLNFGDYNAYLGERPATVLHRIFFLYPMAVDMWLKSPIFGVGFTRFDDFPIHMTNIIPGLISFNTTSVIQHTDLHAHNSYLHVAAECGLIGLLLLYRFLRSIFRAFRNDCEISPVVQLLLGSLMVASLTEHRLTTPSQAGPVFILIGLLWVAHRQREKTQGWSVSEQPQNWVANIP